VVICRTLGQYICCCGYPKGLHRQEAPRLQRDHTILLVIEYFAKLFEVIGNSTVRKFAYGSYSYSTAPIAVGLSLAVSEISSVQMMAWPWKLG